MSRDYNDDGYPRGGDDEYHAFARQEQRPYLVTLTATIRTQVAVNARDTTHAWVLAEEQTADNPPPLPTGMTYVTGLDGRTWAYTAHSGDVVPMSDASTCVDCGEPGGWLRNDRKVRCTACENGGQAA